MYKRRRSYFNFKWLLVLAMFLVTFVTIMLLYPNVKYFRYGYQKGKPWEYETLYAPFRFLVKKSKTQLDAERKQLLAKVTPYFDYKEKLRQQKIQEAKADKSISSTSLNILKRIYRRFIISSGKENPVIYIIKNHISSELKREDFYTMTDIDSLLKHSQLHDTVQKKLQKYIVPNLIYNEKKTNSLNNVGRISNYLGEIQPEELIVSKGELVTKNIFLVLESLKSEYSQRVGVSSIISFVVVGQFLFVAVVLFMLYIFLLQYRSHLFVNRLHLSFVLLSILISVALTRIALNFNGVEIFLIPYILFSLVVRTFIDSRVALFTFLTSILICSFIVPNSYQFLVLELPAGIIAILQLKHLNRRSQLLYTSLFVFISYSILHLALLLNTEGSIQSVSSGIFIRFLLNAIFLTIAYPFLYLLERTFGFLSDVTLLELSNTNTALLRQLSQVAPGTFQHSMQMANIAEEAIMEIGGNPLLIRTGALYHDIGKMENPMYFTENQHGEVSPHKKISLKESAGIIIKHVEDGVKIAKKRNLPKQLIGFIQTHHGRGKAEYFYRSYIKENPNTIVEEDVFTYPGPDPYTKEQAVLMMADACEAATRSLKEKSESNIKELVDKIINSQKEEGRFDNAPITFKDIENIKNIFAKKLSNIYHARIAYPEKNE